MYRFPFNTHYLRFHRRRDSIHRRRTDRHLLSVGVEANPWWGSPVLPAFDGTDSNNLEVDGARDAVEAESEALAGAGRRRSE